MTEGENVLNGQGENWVQNDSYQLKFHYLIKEKKHIESRNAELTRDLLALQEINEKLLESSPLSANELLTTLYKQNSELKRKYQNTIELNMRLECQFLLLQQVMKENENQFRQISYGHEEKITFLRRQIQLKEGLLQLYQDKNKTEKFEEMTPVGFNQISLLFFAEIDQLRKDLILKEQELKSWQNQCKRLEEVTQDSEEKRNHLESLCRTQVSFAQMKLYYSNTVRNRSSVKYDVLAKKARESHQSTAKSQFPSEEQSVSKSNVERTSLISRPKIDKYRPSKEPIARDLAEAYAIFGINERTKSIDASIQDKLRKVAALIQEKNQSLRTKSQTIACLKQELQLSSADRKRLMEAVAKMNTNREFLINELQYYKSTNIDLTSYLTSRKPVKRSKTVMPNQVQKFIQSLRRPKKTSQQFDKVKDFFKAAQRKMHTEKLNLNPFKKAPRRSVSCSLDYILGETKGLGGWNKTILDFSVFMSEENAESGIQIKGIHRSTKKEKDFSKKPVEQLDGSINSSLFFEF